MSSIKPSHLLIALATVFTLAGCGDKNSNVVFSPESRHPAGWAASHKAAAVANLDSCAECHGESFDGGIAGVSCMSPAAISGMTCHATSAADNPVGCVSCHGGLTSGPFGAAKPNTKAAHAKHVALLGTGSCNVCHNNAGSGTANHAKVSASGGISRATVALSLYSTSGGVFGYDSTTTTCASVSCHGGKETPLWTDTIGITANDNTVCDKCHAFGTGQFNSYNSGSYSGTTPATNLHFSHLNRTAGAGGPAKCTDCHNISKLTDYQSHFSGIAAKNMPSPDKTVGNEGGASPTKITTYTSKTCTTNADGCHKTNLILPNIIPARSWVQ